MARPSILNERLILQFCDEIKKCGEIETAIAKSGIGRETFYGWKRAVAAGKGTKLQRRLMKEVDFYLADYASRMEMVITKAALAGDVKAAMWWLELRKPKQYGRRRHYMDPDEETEGTKKVTNAKFSLFGPPGGVKSESDTTETPTNGGSTSTDRSQASEDSMSSPGDLRASADQSEPERPRRSATRESSLPI